MFDWHSLLLVLDIFVPYWAFMLFVLLVWHISLLYSKLSVFLHRSIVVCESKTTFVNLIIPLWVCQGFLRFLRSLGSRQRQGLVMGNQRYNLNFGVGFGLCLMSSRLDEKTSDSGNLKSCQGIYLRTAPLNRSFLFIHFWFVIIYCINSVTIMNEI